MTSLVLAAAFFVGIHVFISGTGLRARLVAAMGERRYLGFFSLLSVVAMVWLVRAYATADTRFLWLTPDWWRWPAMFVTALAFVLVGVGLLTPSPTVVGGEAVLADAEPARGILRVTRHPFLWGVALWAFMHVILNGDAASLVLFGSLLLLALIGPGLIDAKRGRASDDRWQRFTARTSNLPFAAIVAGRNAFRLGEIGWWRIAVALGAWGAFLVAHEWMFGVSPFPL